jgi:hypothetical protein
LTVFGLTKEPRDQAYGELLRAGLRVCERASLVIREPSWLDQRRERVVRELSPYMVASGQWSEWPGTKLLDGTALVNEYALEDESAAILTTAVEGLYDWVAPLPEDLCLLTAGGTPWLVSIAHEQDGYIESTSAELRDLLNRHPVLLDLFDVP